METRLEWHGPAVTAAVAEGAVNGLNAAAKEVQQRARRKTPVKTGALSESLQVAEATSGHLESIVYSDSHYAVYQHELFSYNRGSGQPKFLEAAAREFKNGFQKVMFEHLKGSL